MKKDKKTFIVRAALISILLIFSAVIFWVLRGGKSVSNEEVEKLLEDKKLPVIELYAEYTVDENNLSEVVGDSDYVFIGEVQGYLSTIYDDEREEGVKTVYSVKVLENIKGNLEDKENIQVKKSGGITKDGKNLVVYRYDSLPQKNKIYIFCAYGQSDGSLLCSGFNSSILLENKEYKKESKYKDILNAYDHQIETTRERFQSKYEHK